MPARIRVTKMPDLNAVAKAAADGAAKGLMAGAELLAGEAKDIIRQERFNTGQLAQSIHTTLLPPEGGSLRATVGAQVPYAPFVEYDTRAHVAPFQPFFRWATTKGFRATGRSFRAGSAPQRRLAGIGWAAVRRRGTKGIHFFRRAYEAKHDAAVQLTFRAIREAVRRFAAP